MPIAPTQIGRCDSFDLGGILWAGHEPVRLIPGVLGDARSRQRAFGTVLQKRASSHSAALRASAAARQHELARRRFEDDPKVSAVGLGDRIDVELGRRQDMIG